MAAGYEVRVPDRGRSKLGERKRVTLALLVEQAALGAVFVVAGEQGRPPACHRRIDGVVFGMVVIVIVVMHRMGRSGAPAMQHPVRERLRLREHQRKHQKQHQAPRGCARLMTRWRSTSFLIPAALCFGATAGHVARHSEVVSTTHRAGAAGGSEAQPAQRPCTATSTEWP